jgi:hypothetical protein
MKIKLYDSYKVTVLTQKSAPTKALNRAFGQRVF